MAENPFRAYVGADPFVFVSYAHDDGPTRSDPLFSYLRRDYE